MFVSDSLPWNRLPVPSKQSTIRRGPETEAGSPVSLVACGSMIQLEKARLNRTSVILRRGFIQDRRGMVSPRRELFTVNCASHCQKSLNWTCIVISPSCCIYPLFLTCPCNNPTTMHVQLSCIGARYICC